MLQCGCSLALPATLSTTPSVQGLPPSEGRHPKRYVPPRVRRTDADREMWNEIRVKSRLEPFPAGGGATRLSPAHCFIVPLTGSNC